MKRHLYIFILVLISFSCGKNEKKDDAWVFTWNHQSINQSATKANAYISQIDLGKGPNQIIANDGSGAPYRVNIRLSSLSPSTYFVSLSANKFDYVDQAGFVLAGAEGTVTISSHSNQKLAGNFTVRLINAASDTTLISGVFSGISVTP